MIYSGGGRYRASPPHTENDYAECKNEEEADNGKNDNQSKQKTEQDQ